MRRQDTLLNVHACRVPAPYRQYDISLHSWRQYRNSTWQDKVPIPLYFIRPYRRLYTSADKIQHRFLQLVLTDAGCLSGYKRCNRRICASLPRLGHVQMSRRRIRLLLFQNKASYYLASWALLQLFLSLLIPYVAVWAHLGGFFTGLSLAYLLADKDRVNNIRKMLAKGLYSGLRPHTYELHVHSLGRPERLAITITAALFSLLLLNSLALALHRLCTLCPR
jgi:hypothetical protein